MNDRVSAQLDKVLALADSSHDNEAIVAVRKAREMLSRDGLNFSDLARAAASSRPRLNLPFSFFSNAQIPMESQISELRQQIQDLQEDLRSQSTQAEFWKRRATELEQSLTASTAQSTRWRELARETVEKLWDLGREINANEFATPPGSSPTNDKSERKTA